MSPTSSIKSPSRSRRRSAVANVQRLEDLRASYKCVTVTITILIGPDESVRQVPTRATYCRLTLFQSRAYFPFLESQTHLVSLREDRADVFDYFLYWLYTRRLDHEAVDAIEPIKPAYFWLLHLYCLVDRLDVESCKNAIVDKVARLAEETNSVPTPTDTWIIFETFGALPTCHMRKLIVDLFAWKRTDNLLDNHEDEWHPRFMRDLVVRIKREDIKSGAKPWGSWDVLIIP